jgi:hypothetical protein
MSLMNDTDPILDRARVREVTGVFYSREALDTATNELLLAGFGRSDIDVLNAARELQEGVEGTYIPHKELPDVPSAPRWPFIGRDDVTALNVTIAAIVGSAAAMGTAYLVMASGGSATQAATCAALLGIIAGGVAFSLAGFAFRRKREDFEEQSAWRGLILWVRVRSPEQEDRAQEILRAYGGRVVRAHEIDIEKRASDVPLAKLRPDPWLGPERLGEP